MFRKMRRFKQLLGNDICEEILNRNTCGVLALLGDNGYPYAVPISYIFMDGKLYFHSAKSGHKIDAVNNNSKASFCVVDKDEIVPQEYTTYFRSVILFGNVRIIEDEQQKRKAIEGLAIKYHPLDTEDNRSKAISKEWKQLCMLEMTIEHMTGKEAIELVKNREKVSNDKS